MVGSGESLVLGGVRVWFEGIERHGTAGERRGAAWAGPAADADPGKTLVGRKRQKLLQRDARGLLSAVLRAA